MSDDSTIFFNISFNGKFKKTSSGEVYYYGGSFGTVQSLPEDFLSGLQSELSVSLYSHKMWYKLPFEEMKDLKILYDDTENFQRMCKAARWTRCIDIYIEKDDDSADDGENEEPVDDGQNEEPDVGNEEDDTEESNGDGCEDDTSDSEYAEMCDEEARVEKTVAGIVDDDDEEENPDNLNTPPASDGEEEEERIQYDRWRRGSGELSIRQVFESVEEFKEGVLEYALKGGWNVKYTRWGSMKCEAQCGVVSDTPCPWRIYCSYERSVDQWMVKTYQEEHTCNKDGRCKILSESVIAKLIINDLRKEPTMKPKAIQAQFEERYSLLPSDDQCRKAKKKALDMIQAEYDEQFTRIKDYKLEILDSNPGSTVDLRTMTDGVLEVFDRLYICFAVLRDTWIAHCRPIFGIDGCFLKSSSKGQLLTAVGRDANNQIYPIAWAVVQREDTDSWLWFLEKLKNDLNLGDGEGFTLIPDRQKGLLIVVDQLLPKVEHRMCARHIYGNMRKFHSKKPKLKRLFWDIVKSHNIADYEANMERLKEYDRDLYEAFMVRNPQSCCRAFFKTTSSCEDELNNFSESYNSVIEKARALPIVEMLETMRRQTMIRIEIRRLKTEKWKKKHSKKVAKVLAVEEEERKHCTAIPSSNGMYEAIEKGVSHRVNIRLRTCSCRRWDLTGIPCRHGLRVLMVKKLSSEDYISDWYLTEKLEQQYCDNIRPLNGTKYWKRSGESQVAAPPREVSKGRNKKPQKRMKAVNESPTKGKKVTNHGRTMQCYRCGLMGHNSSKCKNGGVPNKPRKPKKRKTSTTEAETMTLALYEGPSQPTQSTQNSD